MVSRGAAVHVRPSQLRRHWFGAAGRGDAAALQQLVPQMLAAELSVNLCCKPWRAMDWDGGTSGDDDVDQPGVTALHLAASNEGTGAAAARVLLAAGANVNAVEGGDGEGFTPLHSAVEGRYTEVVPLLLAAGADPNKAADGGFTPLEMAKRDPDSIRALLAAGADPDAATHYGTTPLSAAAGALQSSKRPSTVAILLAAGAKNWGKPLRGGSSTFPGLEYALGEVWEEVPARLAELAAHMEPEPRARIRTALLCLRLRTPLAKPDVYMRVLGLACRPPPGPRY